MSYEVTSIPEMATFFLSTLVVLSLSIMWFVSIHKGMVKAVSAVLYGAKGSKKAQ